jgi:cytoskeleton protein RodZ
MMSVGETLRRERLRRKIELASIAAELKISSRMLEAIETDDYDKLPGGVFAKSFVRQYANLLGLDADEVASQFEQAAHLPELTNLAELRRPRPVSGLDRMGERSFSIGRPRNALPSLVVVVVVMLICSAVYGWWQRNRQLAATRHQTAAAAVRNTAAPAIRATPPPARIAPQPPVETAVASAPAPAAAQPPAPAAPAAGMPQPIPAKPGVPQPLVADAGPAGSGAVRVELVVTEPVWLDVQRDGRSIYQGVLQANEIRTLAANNEITLKLGNAGGLTILLNGKPIPSPGPKGQVRTVQLTSGGFQIVPPPPAPAPSPLPKAPAFLAPL